MPIKRGYIALLTFTVCITAVLLAAFAVPPPFTLALFNPTRLFRSTVLRRTGSTPTPQVALMSTSDSNVPARPQTRAEWKKALDSLPDLEQSGGKIPSFYFAHGQPMLIWPKSLAKPSGPMAAIWESQGPDSPMANFLRDFGPALVKKYNPKGIVVFSAHWETSDETLVTDYGSENPLLLDYYGFAKELYDVKFKSGGDSALSERVVGELKKAGIKAKTSPRTQARGRDGRGYMGPGFDHGVFVPFKLMFGDATEIPIVQVSIDESLDMNRNWALGKALQALRSQGILILSGGLTVHTFQDFSAFAEKTAKQAYLDWHDAVLKSTEVSSTKQKEAMIALKEHPGFRMAHPREEHFVPIYVAAGAGEGGKAKTLAAFYGAPTFAFGI